MNPTSNSSKALRGARLNWGTRGFTALLLLLLMPAWPAQAQNTPHIGYVYPAGGRLGGTFQIVVGGQRLGNVTKAFVSGDGAQAEVIEYNRPLAQKEFNDLRDRLKELQALRQAARQSPGGTNVWTTANEREVASIRDKIYKNPPNRQGNPALAETVTLRVTLATNAAPGEREIRLAAANGLSNPLIFCAGQLPEFSSPAAKTFSPEVIRLLERLGQKIPEATRQTVSRISLPAIVNGQILPGAVDHYRFSARQGQRLVIAVSARGLIPYLPDAVPGWFQATLALEDDHGRELAYQDDYYFNPDPVLYYEIKRDGEYTIAVKDAIYRGREDFVYRIAIGELPFVTSLFPLGGPVDTTTAVHINGWNLPATNLIQNVRFAAPGLHHLSVTNDGWLSNFAPFAVDTLPECLELEPNETPEHAQRVTLPIIVNGRIDRPGDLDVFRFDGNPGDEIVAEVTARRLNSPLDSVLELTDAAGKQLAFNDDHEDKGAGLETHHADSYLRATLPARGTYFLHLRDAQHNGGPDYGYRLRLSAPQPDFALRVVPSSVTARGGAGAPLTVYALRQDGFTNAIKLTLTDAPEGFSLGGAEIPANHDQARFTLTAPPGPPMPSFPLSLEGRALVQGRTVSRPAVPADDEMQAFLYRHLVPARELDVAVIGRAFPGVKLLSPSPVRIPAGGTARVRIGPVGPKFTDNFQLELDQPPEGITLKSVSLSTGAAEIELAADASKVKPASGNNLIVTIFTLRNQDAKGKPGAPRRFPVGTLPAIPYEITARE